MRVLYHAINGTGLGHVTRLGAIASSLDHLLPDVHQLIITNSTYVPQLAELGFPYAILPAEDGGPWSIHDRRHATVPARLGARLLLRMVEEYVPDLVVFDTHFPPPLVAHLKQRVRHQFLVLRACRSEYTRRLIESRILPVFDRVLLAHSEQSVRNDLDEETAQALLDFPNVECVGPIARTRATEAVPQGGKPPPLHGFVLISAGACGYQQSALQFLERSCEVVSELATRHGLEVVVAVGPYLRAARTALAVGRIIEAPTNLDAWIARARLVVAHAGYNTVNEILVSGTPAVLVPLERANEDQSLRATALARKGRVSVYRMCEPPAKLATACERALHEPRHVPEEMPGALNVARSIRDCLRPLRLSLGKYFSNLAATTVESVEQLAVMLANLPLEQCPRICIDSRQLESLGSNDHLLSSLRTSAATTSVPPTCRGHWEIVLGHGSADAVYARAMTALAVLDHLAVPKDRRTLIFASSLQAGQLPLLVEKLHKRPLRELVMCVPEDELEDGQGSVYEAFERCRALGASFRTDITSNERPRLGLQLP